MKSLKTFFFLFAGSLSLFAQDAVFNQFQNAPLQNNPALAGAEANGRLIVNYQFGTSTVLKSFNYNFISTSYDRAFNLKNGDQLGLGIRTQGWFGFQEDKTLFGGFSIAYRKFFDEGKHILAAGMEGGPGQRTFSLAWPSNPPFRSTEAINLFDFNAGLSYMGHFNKIKELQVGIAYHHLNRANVAIIGNNVDRLYRRFAAHGSLLFALTKNSLLRPQVFTRLQGPSISLGGGAMAIQKFEGKYSNFALNFGGYLNFDNRLADETNVDDLTLVIGPEYKGFALNYSRNFDVSDLRRATDFYGLNELSLIWKM